MHSFFLVPTMQAKKDYPIVLGDSITAEEKRRLLLRCITAFVALSRRFLPATVPRLQKGRGDDCRDENEQCGVAVL